MPVYRGADLAYAQLPGRLSADPFSGGDVGTCSARVVRVAPGPRTPHRHPHSVEVIYVVEGAGRLWEDDEVTEVSAGDVLVVEQGVPHATVCSDSIELVLMCFFPHPDLSSNLEELDGPARS